MQTNAEAHDAHAPAASRLAALRRDALQDAGSGLLLLTACAAALAAGTPVGAAYVLKAVGVFGIALAFMWRGLAQHAPHARFGPGNRVTLLRLALISLVAACIGERPSDAIAWGVVVVATLAAVLDALDGPLARAHALASEFGARFDMESDALLVLVLCLLLVQFDKAGAWIVAAGLMRYAFVLAAHLWPWLTRPLPPSWRRKAVCVVLITVLIVCLGPIIERAWSQALAALSLALVTASFALDVVWLLRRRTDAAAVVP